MEWGDSISEKVSHNYGAKTEIGTMKHQQQTGLKTLTWKEI